MQYDKKKEAIPEDTVKKIQNVLKKIGIDKLDEISKPKQIDDHCVESLILSLPGDISCSSNGKGTTVSYARASAYGEFMERLQNGSLFSILPPDTKKITVNELLDSGILKYYFNEDENKISKYIQHAVNICCNFANFSAPDSPCVEVMPFYHFNNKKIEYIPHHLMMWTSGYTGSCAGNTSEEALVEGLSEIFERYVVRKAVKDPIAFPDIPEDVYMKYDVIKNIIKYVNKIGFSVVIKDASLDGKYPVACAVLREEKNNGYYVWFGSHPSLPIAIERCFTEIFQGKDFSNVQFVNTLFKFEGQKDNPIPLARVDNVNNNSFMEVNSEFFTKKPDYEYKEENWSKYKNLTNVELFNKLLKGLISDGIDVFIRDVSFLDFPSYIICIPELMSNFYDINPDSGLDLRLSYYKTVRILGENLPVMPTVQDVMDFFKYFFHLQFALINQYKNIEMFYVITLFHIKQYKRALNIVNSLKRSPKYIHYIKMLNFLSDYLLLLENGNVESEAEFTLYKKYGKNFSSKLISVFNNEKSFENAVLSLKKHKLYSLKHTIKDSVENKKKIGKNIMDIYKKNIPEQMAVSNLLKQY